MNYQTQQAFMHKLGLLHKKTPNDQTLFLYLIQGTLAANDALNQFEEKVWGDPIVMNTKEELNHAFEELRNHSFIKHG